MSYGSGSALANHMTFASQSFASLGLTPGTYAWTWGSGAYADSVRVQVGPVAWLRDNLFSSVGNTILTVLGLAFIYVALSGPHLGIDLNFRHPLHTLVIASTPANAPIGRGPMPWTWFSALQCVNWGPDVPWYNNPYANSVCTSRGGTWPDFFNRIYVSNLTGLDSDGKPVARESLKAMNVREGVASLRDKRTPKFGA